MRGLLSHGVHEQADIDVTHKLLFQQDAVDSGTQYKTYKEALDPKILKGWIFHRDSPMRNEFPGITHQAM